MPSVDDVTKCLAPKAADCLAGICAEINSIFDRSIKPSLLHLRIPSTNEQIVDAEFKLIEQFGGWPPTLRFEVLITTEGGRILRSEYILVADLAKSNLILRHAGVNYGFKTTQEGAGIISAMVFKDLREGRFAVNAA